jgi:hypothetical protein
LKPENKFGLVYVKYMVSETPKDKEKLIVYEKNMVLFEKDFNFNNIDPNNFFDLIPSAKGISFEYLKPPKEGLEEEAKWEDNWNPENDQGFPLAIKLIVVDEPETTPLVVIAPLHQQEE